MNNHITSAEWAEYKEGKGSGEERLKLFARVHAHIGSCEMCRKMHEDYVLFRSRMEAFSEKGKAAAMPGGYRAVASAEMDASFGELGVLSVELGDGKFLYETLEVSGDCEKYAFVPEEDAPRLVDECDEGTWMEIEDGKLRLSFPENDEVEVVAVVYAAEGDAYALLFDENGCAEFPLEPNARCRLEIELNALEN